MTRLPPNLPPSLDPVLLTAAMQVWRDNQCICEQVIRQYRNWVLHFQEYCRIKRLGENDELTRAGARRFAMWYAKRRRCSRALTIEMTCSALGTWAAALKVLGKSLPPWETRVALRPSSPVQEEFVKYLIEVCGNPDRVIRLKLYYVDLFDSFRRARDRLTQALHLPDIDAFVLQCHKRFARKTVLNICSSLRSYLRFLFSTGRLQTDLATYVIAPSVRSLEKPYRTLPWPDIQRMLRAINRSSRCGKRDYALLLMMSTYGLAAGEMINLTLDDLDWKAMTIRIVRRKTNVEFLLPLMPAVGRALASYLRHGRPPHAPDRHVFVTMRSPHRRLAEVSTLRHVLQSAAGRAGVSGPFLGTHVFRHTHACRQMEIGTRPKLIGDILGHRHPQSTSAYLRVAAERLRVVTLPVPR